MKPINSKEKSKQVWQFIFIFFLMCIVPVALIFFSYYKLPEEISKEEQKKLESYSNFEHAQKILIQQLANIDSNVNLLAMHNASGEGAFISSIQAAFVKLKTMENPTPLQLEILKGYEAHYNHVVELNKTRDAGSKSASSIADLQTQLKTCQDANRDLRMTVPTVTQPH